MADNPKKSRARKSEAVLPGNKKSTVATEVRIYEIAELIVKRGWGRQACMEYARTQWELSDTQAERYYYGALNYLMPKDPDKYREVLIGRNFSVLEQLLQGAIDRNDTKVALDVVKAMNQMLGVGAKQVEINDKDAEGGEKKIVISFSD